MRILSYNILEGGEGRADPLCEVILAQDADVVALIEADDAAVLDRLARRTKMDVIHAAGKKGSVALLSRFPIRDSINHSPLITDLTNAFLQATVVDPAGVAWQFGVVHLKARATEEREQIRDRELAAILNTFAPLRAANTAHVLLGDFNANSPHQKIDFAKCKPETREEAQANGGCIPRRAIQSLFDHGYLDTLHTLRPDYAATQGTFSTQYPGQRVDYIFTHGLAAACLKSAWIEYDRLAQYASDHYPVGVEIG